MISKTTASLVLAAMLFTPALADGASRYNWILPKKYWPSDCNDSFKSGNQLTAQKLVKHDDSSYIVWEVNLTIMPEDDGPGSMLDHMHTRRNATSELNTSSLGGQSWWYTTAPPGRNSGLSEQVEYSVTSSYILLYSYFEAGKISVTISAKSNTVTTDNENDETIILAEGPGNQAVAKQWHNAAMRYLRDTKMLGRIGKNGITIVSSDSDSENNLHSDEEPTEMRTEEEEEMNLLLAIASSAGTSVLAAVLLLLASGVSPKEILEVMPDLIKTLAPKTYEDNIPPKEWPPPTGYHYKGKVWYQPPGETGGPRWIKKSEYDDIRAAKNKGLIYDRNHGWISQKDSKLYADQRESSRQAFKRDGEKMAREYTESQYRFRASQDREQTIKGDIKDLTRQQGKTIHQYRRGFIDKNIPQWAIDGTHSALSKTKFVADQIIAYSSAFGGVPEKIIGGTYSLVSKTLGGISEADAHYRSGTSRHRKYSYALKIGAVKGTLEGTTDVILNEVAGKVSGKITKGIANKTQLAKGSRTLLEKTGLGNKFIKLITRPPATTGSSLQSIGDHTLSKTLVPGKIFKNGLIIADKETGDLIKVPMDAVAKHLIEGTSNADAIESIKDIGSKIANAPQSFDEMHNAFKESYGKNISKDEFKFLIWKYSGRKI